MMCAFRRIGLPSPDRAPGLTQGLEPAEKRRPIHLARLFVALRLLVASLL
jgi:hypothetical protein